jgi:formylglycine-generating enzyme required for sulfatase activity
VTRGWQAHGARALAALLLAVGMAAGSETSVTNSIGMQLVLVPAGELTIGSRADDPDADPDERPARRLRMSSPFYLGRHEVTQDEYSRVTGDNPSWFQPDGPGAAQVGDQETGRLPVDMVSWDEAVAFCRRLSQLPAERSAGRTYRLPTEAEWEYACRAGTSTRFACGDELTLAQANVRGESAAVATTRPVGSYPPNAWGLCDMHGNVWEWCSDAYDAEAYRTAVAVDPQGPADGTGRVVRGGDWQFPARFARSANRDFTRASRRDLGNGFRVVCEAP